MKVTLLRHATRDFTLGDVPLNTYGVQQSFELAKNNQLLLTETLLCSPKQRAQMTIEPLALKLNKEIKIQENLDQMMPGESDIDFSDRVQSFLNKFEEQQWASPLLICSHSDWLSVAVSLIPTTELNLDNHLFQCAEFLTFEIKDGLWVKL